MDVDLDVRLVSRDEDRVLVAVQITPLRAAVTVDGVAVELFNRQQESLGPRMLLPVSGQLAGPLQTAVELRSTQGALQLGGTVVATAWSANRQVTACCPADMWTAFERHLKGRGPVALPKGHVRPETLVSDEFLALRRVFTWLPEPPEEEDVDELINEFAGDLGLDDDDAEWLRDLMHEDDPA